MDWNNIDLKSAYERNKNLLENYTFETLLLEVHCNLREVNRETVKAEALKQIKSKYEEAIEILEANLDNLTQYAIEEKKEH